MFAETYVQTGNASEAYRTAYDAERMKPASVEVAASQLLHNHKVTIRVRQLQAQVAEKHEITRDWIVSRLVDTYDKASRSVAVLDRKGELTGEYAFQGAVWNWSLELLARMGGYLVDRSVSKQMTGTPEQYAEALALERKYDAMDLDELVTLRDSGRALAAEGSGDQEGAVVVKGSSYELPSGETPVTRP